jgi:hypothetical protein
MKKIILLLAAFQLISCKNLIKEEVNLQLEGNENIAFEEPAANKNTVITVKEDLLGYWVGDFTSDMPEDETKRVNDYEEDELDVDYDYNKKITFSIDNITRNNIKGHSIVSGNIQKFDGTISEVKNGFIIQVKEPGSQKYDGRFELKIKKNDTLMTGSFETYKPEPKKISKRKLTLQKRIFEYDPNSELVGPYIDYDNTIMKKIEYDDTDSLGNTEKLYYDDEQYYTTTDTIYNLNPSTHVFTKKLVENLTKGDIHVLRNLVFARHGYAFKDKKLRQFFDYQKWYMPVFSDVTKDLTKIEIKNVDLLSRYETNAKAYYRHFGR